jgi:opacity protein-like surface antigen
VAVLAAGLVSRSARADTLFAIYSGKSFTQDTSLTVEQPSQNTKLTFHGVSYQDRSFTDPIYYGGRITHFFKSRPGLGLALDFVHFKVYAESDRLVHTTGIENGEPVDRTQRLGDTIESFSISHGVNMLSLNAVGRLRWLRSKKLQAGHVQPYAGIGVGGLIMHPESKIGGRFFEQYEWNGFGWQGFVGSNFLITRRVGLFGEYRFTRTDADVTVVGGRAQTPLTTHHVVFGTLLRL